MASGDVVRIANVGDFDYVGGFNGRTYTIPAHGQLMVDYDAMCLWLGHPEANDFDPRNRVRQAEFERLRTKYGVDAKALEMSLNHESFDADELFRAMRPQLEVYDMADKRIMTVADDPNGDFLAPVVAASDSGDMSVIMARLQSMEQEQANLRSQLANAQRREQALNEAQPLDVDGPPGPVNQDQGIPGTVITSEEPSQAPRDPAVTEAGEDQPTRIRVSQP